MYHYSVCVAWFSLFVVNICMFMTDDSERVFQLRLWLLLHYVNCGQTHSHSLTRIVTQTNKQRLMIDLRPFIFVSISIPSLLILFTLSLFFIRCDPDLPPVMCRPYALTLCQDTDFISVNI